MFEAGQSEKIIMIEVINDGNPEPNEQFEVILSNPRDGAALGEFSRGIVF